MRREKFGSGEINAFAEEVSLSHTDAVDFAPIKQMQLAKFDGTIWQLFGDVISGSEN